MQKSIDCVVQKYLRGLAGPQGCRLSPPAAVARLLSATGNCRQVWLPARDVTGMVSDLISTPSTTALTRDYLHPTITRLSLPFLKVTLSKVSSLCCISEKISFIILLLLVD